MRSFAVLIALAVLVAGGIGCSKKTSSDSPVVPPDSQGDYQPPDTQQYDEQQDDTQLPDADTETE